MKKVILTAINARYFHTNLAVRCLKAASGKGQNVEIVERTINDSSDDIIQQIALKNPDAVGFSCYIWNIEKILKIADDLKKILPNCFIFMGGPEVSYDSIELLCQNRFIDMIIIGEGELIFSEWIKKIDTDMDISNILGTVQRVNNEIIQNPPNTNKYDLNELPFLYDNLEEYDNKIVYFETSRGCPFKCSYCMSSLLESMVYMDVDKVLFAFEYFLKNNVQQVKLVDRTFNYPIKRANEILEKLITLSKKYPDSKTNFHFEITGTQVNDEMIDILRKAPEGLIQFEIGIQSTNHETLEAINRKQDKDKLFNIIKKILALKNIVVYIDLIAGLPYESYSQFANSFNDAYLLGAHKIHLGFLKVLKGSDIRRNAKKYGIVYTSTAPYKVLKTSKISYRELVLLDKVEQLVEIYKNSRHYNKTMLFVIDKFETPFELFEKFSFFLEDKAFFGNQNKITTQFELLFEFLSSNNIDTDILRTNMQFDWLMIEKPRRFPKYLKIEYTQAQKKIIRRFYNNNDNIKKYLSVYIDYSPSTISRMCYIAFVGNKDKAILFDYDKNAKKRAQIISI